MTTTAWNCQNRVQAKLIDSGIYSFYEASPSESLYSHWISFKAQYGKKYANQAEEAKRLELLTKNKLAVDQFNQEQSKQAGYTLAVNHLSDRTDEELKQVLGFEMSPELMLRQQSDHESSESFIKKILEDDTQELPESIDWREHGRVGRVKDQGACSGWAFANTGILEGQQLPIKQIATVISLSEQNLLDCTKHSNFPCQSGSVMSALSDVAAENGIESEEDYPYKGSTSPNSCTYNQSKSVITAKGYGLVPTGDEEALKKTVAKYGPVAVSIEVSRGGNFTHYKSGVYTDEHCSKDPLKMNHFVLVVGYGTDPQGGDYWLVKNSWSDAWGDKGYVKMARNRGNMCHIAQQGVVAIF